MTDFTEEIHKLKDRAEADESYRLRCLYGEKVFFAPSHEAVVSGHIYSDDGIREYEISRCCEYHFDKAFKEEE